MQDGGRADIFDPMTSQAYRDPRLAALYDALNPPDASDAFYLELAEGAPRRILDLGCGTGRLAADFARKGHAVTGVDPAEGMLAVARNRPDGALVDWVWSDAVGLRLERVFDLVVMTGHVFQVFPDDAAMVDALAAARRHLAPGGMLDFDTRNPAARAWEGWTAAITTREVDLPASGAVRVAYDVRAVVGEHVTYVTIFDFGAGDVLEVPDRLRFVDRDRLESLLRRAGLRTVDCFGDWDRAPFRPASREIIVLAVDRG